MKLIIEVPEGFKIGRGFTISEEYVPIVSDMLSNAKEAGVWDNEKHSIDGKPVKLYAVKGDK